MSNVLCVSDIKDGKLKKVTKELISAARNITGYNGGQIIALLFGNENLVPELGDAGADVVCVSDLEFSPEGVAEVISKLAKEKDAKVILSGHTYEGRDYAPRVAAKLSAGIVNDVIEVKYEDSKVTVKKPTYSGKAFAYLQINSENAVVTLRPNSVEIEEKKGAGTVEKVSIDGSSIKTKITDKEVAEGTKIQLSDANIIISGGRGMKSPENYKILQELCDVLGAALGASRAAVDSGWIDHSHQVGQTGKTVSPTLYIACGISGAIQHLAGMNSSKYIVAINKDSDAPILKVATYGIVADLFEVVPELTKEFKKVLE